MSHLDESQALEKVYDRFVSKKWYLVINSRIVNDLAERMAIIEKKYFLNENKKYFELVEFPDKNSVFMFKKENVPRQVVEEVLVLPLIDDRDVICPRTPEMPVGEPTIFEEELADGFQQLRKIRFDNEDIIRKFISYTKYT